MHEIIHLPERFNLQTFSSFSFFLYLRVMSGWGRHFTSDEVRKGSILRMTGKESKADVLGQFCLETKCK